MKAFLDRQTVEPETEAPLVRFYLTTAIDYVNSRPHLGTAYEKITADVIARYKRLSGFETHFLMGNDEHSQNVYKRALERGMDPLAYCDQMEQEFRAVWKQLDISFDDFIRTTEPRHRAAVQKLAQTCFDNGDIYEGYYEGWYCVSCEAFKQEKDLVDGKCPLHPTLTPEWIREKNYFFRLSKYREPLLAHFRAHPGVPGARRPAQRDPPPARSRARGHFGQPRGSALGHSAAVRARQRRLRLVRRADQLRGGGRVRHRRGALREVVAGRPAHRRQGHHAVPHRGVAGDADERRRRAAEAGVRARLGQLRRPAHEQVARHEPRSVGRRAAVRRRIRFGSTSTKEISYGGDGDFTWERYEERYNVDLANNLGNLVSRLAAMAEKYRDLAAGAGGRRRPPGAGRGSWRSAATGRRWMPWRCTRRGRGVPDRRCDQRIHRRDGAVDAGEGSGRRRPARRGAVRGGGGHPARGRAAAAGHALVVGGDPAPRRRDDGGRAICGSIATGGGGPTASEQIVKGAALWPRAEEAPEAGPGTRRPKEQMRGRRNRSVGG